jgi:ribosomal protein S18 acetylase RimI-like enzyme
VAPKQRGRGVGKALLAAVEATARERGACKLTLEVLVHNTRAQVVYQAHGFTAGALDDQMLFFTKSLTT